MPANKYIWVYTQFTMAIFIKCNSNQWSYFEKIDHERLVTSSKAVVDVTCSPSVNLNTFGLGSCICTQWIFTEGVWSHVPIYMFLAKIILGNGPIFSSGRSYVYVHRLWREKTDYVIEALLFFQASQLQMFSKKARCSQLLCKMQ